LGTTALEYVVAIDATDSVTDVEEKFAIDAVFCDTGAVANDLVSGDIAVDTRNDAFSL
jgi:hypothetical protein